MGQYLTQLLGAPVLLEQPLAPGRHQFRQAEQPQGVAGGGGVENNQIEAVLLINDRSNALQQAASWAPGDWRLRRS